MTDDYGLTIKLSEWGMKDYIKYLTKTVIIVHYICTQMQLQKSLAVFVGSTLYAILY